MSTKIRLSTRDDVAGIIPKILGFHPEESLVVVGIGGPSCRVDLDWPDAYGHTMHQYADQLQNGCIVVIYSADALKAAVVFASLDTILPGVARHDAFRIDKGYAFEPAEDEGVPLAATDYSEGAPAHASRADLAAMVTHCNDAHEAEVIAWAAYHRGDGALAWCYHDRARELGRASDALTDLAHRLTNAIAPTGDVNEEE